MVVEVLERAQTGWGCHRARRPHMAVVQVVVEAEAGLVWVSLIQTV
jgi:hypothetical protein